VHATMSLPSAVCILVPHRTSDDRCVAALVPMIVAFLPPASKRLRWPRWSRGQLHGRWLRTDRPWMHLSPRNFSSWAGRIGGRRMVVIRLCRTISSIWKHLRAARGRMIGVESSMKELTTIPAHTGHVTSVLFSPDGKTLVSAGMDKTVKVWAVPQWKLLRSFEAHEKSVNALAFSPDGTLLATGSTDTTVRLWAFSSGEPLSTLKGHRRTVAGLAASSDGRLLASASYDATVRLWSLPSGEALSTLEGHPKNVTAVAFSPDGATLASSGLDSAILLWSLPSGELMHRIEGHEVAVGSLAFSPDGRFLASLGYEQTAKLWSTEDWTVVRSLHLGARPGFLAFAPDNRTLAVGREYNVVLWSIEDDTPPEELAVGVKGVYQLSFSPDGGWLALAAADKKVRIWELT
jgi:WD40 repeat protein